MAFNATPMSPDANSFVTVEEANAYQEGRMFNSAWTSASTADKEAALRWATNLLDDHFEWRGALTDYEQRLGWPRANVWHDKVLLDSEVVPRKIKDATAELAFRLLAADRTLFDEPESQGIKSLSVGPINLSFDQADRAGIIPNSVKRICYLFSTGGEGTVPVRRA